MRRYRGLFATAAVLVYILCAQTVWAQDMPPQPQAATFAASAVQSPSKIQPPASQNIKTISIAGEDIVLPTVPAYREIFGQSPALDAMFRQFVPSTNTLQALYLSDADIDALRKNPNGGFHDYIMVQSLTQDMVLRSAEDFDDVKKQVKDGFKNTDDMNSLAQKELDTASGYMNKTYNMNAHLAIGQTRVAGIPVDDAQALSMTVLANYGYSTPKGTVGVPMVMSLNVINVKNRVLYMFVYNKYKDESDIEGVARVANDYRHALFALNGTAPQELQEAQDQTSGNPPGRNMGWLNKTIIGASALILLFLLISVFASKGKLRDAILGRKGGDDGKDSVI